MTAKLILCRSDRGDGGWSLHAPGSTDEEIACGDSIPLKTGEAEWNEETGKWNRPDDVDYAKAYKQLAWNECELRYIKNDWSKC